VVGVRLASVKAPPRYHSETPGGFGLRAFPLCAAVRVISFRVLASASESTGQPVDHDLRERLGLFEKR
jgi:hypothetical protein